MKRTTNNRSSYAPPPVERLSLPEGDTRRRWIAVIALLILGLLAIGVGVNAALSHESGWTEIEARAGSPGNAGEFLFQYCLDEKNSTTQYRLLTALYSASLERAAQVYSSAGPSEGIGNLWTLSSHPNETVTLEPELYDSLALIQRYGNRVLYLAPLYESYGSLFFCEEDWETVDFDPVQNPELAASFAELAAFANDPAQINVELLGENRAQLQVSEEYLRYAEANGVGSLLDLSWMKNAFVLDDLCRALRAQGFTHGYLQSLEGYGCNLSETGEGFSMQIFDGTAAGVGLVAQMEYAKPIAYAALRGYSLNPMLGDGYYEFENGDVRAIYLDPSDGQPKAAIDDLLLWSSTLGCGELLLRACPVYLAAAFEPTALDTPELSYAYCQGQTLFCNDPDVRFPLVAEGYTVRQEGKQ